MWSLLRCIWGPRLHRLYKTENFQGKDYEKNALEHYSDLSVRLALGILSFAWSLGIYASPVVITFMYRRGFMNYEAILSLSKFSGSVGVFIFVLIVLRGLGRAVNSDYVNCVSSIDAYKQRKLPELRLQMSRYDFDFGEWPVDFRSNESLQELQFAKQYLRKGSQRSEGVQKFVSLPCDALSYFAIHAFGRGMIYPGSLSFLNYFLSPALLKGRAKLVEDYGGQRFKLLTEDGNEIDSMFIDRRNGDNASNGKILVICCEGNAGFYEYGITLTPIDAGYSVLGWNHPGFAFSTGLPFPSQELNAADVVMQFAVTKLGYQLENIVVYAWSIGGFSATWLAMNYPNIKGLVLDATFDDIIPLAVPRMPQSWKPLVVKTIRDHMNLNNAEQLVKYNGPVLLFRRSRDEIISTIASRSIQTNRGNDLLIRLLQARYPMLVNNDTLWALTEWVSRDRNQQMELWNQQEVDEDICISALDSYTLENGNSFPLLIGEGMSLSEKIQLLLFLANKHMVDYDSTHCIPLPSRVFKLPWDISQLFKQASSSPPSSTITVTLPDPRSHM